MRRPARLEAPMLPVRLIHWNASGAEEKARHLRDAGYVVDCQPLDGPASPRARPPEAARVPTCALAGYSGTPLPKKLGIRAGFVVVLADAPTGFEETLGPLPEDVRLVRRNRGRRDLTIWFVRSRAELERGV